MPAVQGVHLVGPTSLPDTANSLRACTAALPNRLKRIPDGETGPRHLFTTFQGAFFSSSSAPEMMTDFATSMSLTAAAGKPQGTFTAEEVVAEVGKLRAADPKTGYEDAAIESYAVFRRLRDDDEEGVIPPGVGFQAAVAPVYEAALFRSIRELQSQIPHGELSIQINLAADTAFWEGVMPPWFFPGADEVQARKGYMLDYTVGMLGQIDADVEVGLHNCYGDLGHRHFMEPEDRGVVVERGLALFARADEVKRQIQYLHLPVPVSAMGKLQFLFGPLKELVPVLKASGTELYLGVVQANDLEGTRTRIEAARLALGEFPFGVATECGWGRTPPQEIESILSILCEVSEPVAAVVE